MTGLEQFHQRKRDDETDSGPFEASQSGVKHPGPSLAQPNAALNSRKLSELRVRAWTVPRFFDAFLAGNALTAIARFVYARLHD
jgi:hypothetical protein